MPEMFRRLIPFLLCLLLPATFVQAAEEARRPRVGLVLGGGGARGAAHIGVLEVLEKLRVPVDCVAGTSMGALVAGVYASGMAPAVMREQLAEADWADMFIDNPEYSEMSHRNKSVARRFPAGTESGLGSDGVRYPSGVVSGQKIKLFFNQLVRANQGERNIEDLPLPLSIIATDIGNGERVVLRDGLLSKAMRASMSVPGLLAPVDHQGHKLVDGGLVDNLPISEVRERCKADVVIAVNVGSPLMKAEEVGSLLTVSAQMVNILTEQNVTRSLATLRSSDIYIKPDLTGISAADFARSPETADRGRLATEALAGQLARLSVDAPSYAAWWKAIEVSQRDSPRVDDIEIVGLSRVNPAVVQRYLQAKQGDTIGRANIRRDLLRMYGDGYYESVDYTVLTQRERNVLRVMPVEKSWGPDYLRFAFNLQADNSQGSAFGLRAGYHKTWLNDLGGELLTVGDIGSANRLSVNYYQPLDLAQRYFLEGKAAVEQSHLNIYDDDQRIAQYKVGEGSVSLALGVNVGLLGPVRLGWLQRHVSYERDIGQPSLPSAKWNLGGWKAALDFDQFDRLYFPTRGWSAQLSYFESPGADYARADADLRGAFSVGDTVFNGRFRYAGSPKGVLPIHDAAALGGFMNLMAYAPNQVLADNIRYLGLRAERIVGHMPLGLRGDMRVGLGLEAARVGDFYTESNGSGTLNSVALYFGGETALGPANIGIARSSTGVSNIFLFIGTP